MYIFYCISFLYSTGYQLFLKFSSIKWINNNTNNINNIIFIIIIIIKKYKINKNNVRIPIFLCFSSSLIIFICQKTQNSTWTISKSLNLRSKLLLSLVIKIAVQLRYKSTLIILIFNLNPYQFSLIFGVHLLKRKKNAASENHSEEFHWYGGVIACCQARYAIC